MSIAIKVPSGLRPVSLAQNMTRQKTKKFHEIFKYEKQIVKGRGEVPIFFLKLPNFPQN
jgi:hypothetical protein